MKKMFMAFCLIAMASTALAGVEPPNWKEDVTLKIMVPPQPEGHRFGQLLVEITAEEQDACYDSDKKYERLIVAQEDDKNILYVVDNYQDQTYKGPFHVVPQPDKPITSAAMRLCPEEDRDRKYKRTIRFIVWHKALKKNIYLHIPKGTFSLQFGDPEVKVGWGSMPLYAQ